MPTRTAGWTQHYHKSLGLRDNMLLTIPGIFFKTPQDAPSTSNKKRLYSARKQTLFAITPVAKSASHSAITIQRIRVGTNRHYFKYHGGPW